MYFAIWRKIEKSSQEEYLKYYPDLSIVITKALVDSSVIALSRIYDTHKDSTADIYSLLNSIESDKSFINSGNLTEIKQFVKEQEKVLNSDEFKTLINNLKTWRDKYYAHRDKIFLNDEERINEMTMSELMGGKRRLKISIKINACYVEEPDTTKTR